MVGLFFFADVTNKAGAALSSLHAAVNICRYPSETEEQGEGCVYTLGVFFFHVNNSHKKPKNSDIPHRMQIPLGKNATL